VIVVVILVEAVFVFLFFSRLVVNWLILFYFLYSNFFTALYIYLCFVIISFVFNDIDLIQSNLKKKTL